MLSKCVIVSRECGGDGVELCGCGLVVVGVAFQTTSAPYIYENVYNSTEVQIMCL